jgi:hypothetical protein
VPLIAELDPIVIGASSACTQTFSTSRVSQTRPVPQSPSTVQVCGVNSVEQPTSKTSGISSRDKPLMAFTLEVFDGVRKGAKNPHLVVLERPNGKLWSPARFENHLEHLL